MSALPLKRGEANSLRANQAFVKQTKSASWFVEGTVSSSLDLVTALANCRGFEVETSVG